MADCYCEMKPLERLPVSIQTLYADLADKAWTGNFREVMASGGTPYKRTHKGREYWYWQPPTKGGNRPSARYLGPDSPEVRRRIQDRTELAAARKDRLEIVRALRAARLPLPDGLSGNVLAVLAEAGAFRLRAVVVGSVAFQCYGPMLGFRMPRELGRTGDVDIGQFHAVSLAVDDEIDADLLSVLRRADPRFKAIPSPADTRRTQRYAIRAGTQETFSVDVLSPLRGQARTGPTNLKALRGHAQLLRFLDFLIYREVEAVALHGPGVPIKVPTPERFALHKLIVSRRRIDTVASQAKARKDLAQAEILLRALAKDRPYELDAAWQELQGRGPAWRQMAERAKQAIPKSLREILPKSGIPLAEPQQADHSKENRTSEQDHDYGSI